MIASFSKAVLIAENLSQKHGVIITDSRKVFYKKLDLSLGESEVNGWDQLKDFYPIADLLAAHTRGDTKYLFYRHEEGAEKVDLLLYQFIETYDVKKIEKILFMYRKVFQKTISSEKQLSSKVFFFDRLGTRLTKWYENSENLQSDLLKTQHLNGFPLRSDITFSEIFETAKLASTREPIISILSQCDPNDLNITTKPLLLDYTAGGYVPLMAEFATFIWYHLAQAQYLAPLLNQEAFSNHPDIYDNLDSVDGDVLFENITHIPNQNRVSFIQKYTEDVVSPVFILYDEWYRDFLGFITMKILCVFNLEKTGDPGKQPSARQLSVAYLKFFYSINPKSPAELIEKITNLHKLTL